MYPYIRSSKQSCVVIKSFIHIFKPRLHIFDPFHTFLNAFIWKISYHYTHEQINKKWHHQEQYSLVTEPIIKCSVFCKEDFDQRKQQRKINKHSKKKTVKGIKEKTKNSNKISKGSPIKRDGKFFSDVAAKCECFCSTYSWNELSHCSYRTHYIMMHPSIWKD